MYGFMFLILLYSAPVFFAVESLVANTHSTVIYIIFNIIFAAIACFLAFIRIVNKGYWIRQKPLGFVWLGLFIVVSFWLTHYRYGSVNASYLTAFLFMGVQVIPTIIMACFLEEDDLVPLQKAAFVLILLFTVSVWFCIMKSGGIGLYNQLYNSEINTYASLGYSMAYAYSFSLIFFMHCKQKTPYGIVFRIFMGCLLPAQLLAIFTLGGKAPLLAVAAVTAVSVLFCRKDIRLALIVAVVACVAVCSPFLVNLASVQRFINITKDMSTMGRIALWKNALQVGLEHPVVGNGIGSEYYVLGFRTHNIFMDVLVEYGIIGPIVVAIALFTVGIELLRMTYREKRNLILLVIFVNSVISLLVSGYYLSEPAIWGIIIYVLLSRARRKFEK